tara:strand:- start:228 stop:422 length:195 start_codon:yes stop_codon:yes gene_type:complete
MITKYIIAFILSIYLFSSGSVYSRCAVCYTNGMSGASIAVIIIVTSFIILIFANKFLRKIIDKE